jgi:hypothetical protein
MGDKTLLFFALMGVVLMACGALIVWRLRRFAAMREDAERRATVAFEEMQRTVRELRERGAERGGAASSSHPS